MKKLSKAAKKTVVIPTDWFNGKRYNPGSPGVYQRKLRGKAILFSRWTGKFWMLGFRTLEDATTTRVLSVLQDADFRGLRCQS